MNELPTCSSFIVHRSRFIAVTGKSDGLRMVELEGTPVARPGGMARRIGAFLGIVVIVTLMLILFWRVYLHHQSAVPRDESSIVELACQPA